MEDSVEAKNWVQKLRVLPIAIQRQVIEYLEFLHKKYAGSSVEPQPFRFDWAGGLEEETKSAVELQHEANQLR